MDEDQPLLPLDERFRQAEQYSLDLTPPPRTQPPKTYAEEKPCGNLGYCYCPKCNPKQEVKYLASLGVIRQKKECQYDTPFLMLIPLLVQLH